MHIRHFLYLGAALIAPGHAVLAQTTAPPDGAPVDMAAPAEQSTAVPDSADRDATKAAVAGTRVTPPSDEDPQAAAVGAALAASPDAELRDAANELFDPIPLAAELPHGAPMTRAKIDLGAMLFFDPRMSKSGVFSCQSCHNIGMGGTDALETSIGHGWQQGPRNSPTMLNAVFNVAQFWDGRAEDLAEQAKGPVQAGVEMNNTPENLIETLRSMPGYVDAFEASFPGQDEPITFDNFAHAIEAFEATLLTPNSRFDQWLQGTDGAMTDREKRGLQAFMDTGCATCHAGINFGGEGYYPFGLVEAPDDEVRPEDDMGRFSVTSTADDEYVFRAAPLRNVELTAPYFHSGKVWNLPDAVKIMSTAQLGTELTEEQAADITAFLATLTGEQPQVVHPTLPVRAAATPLPAPIDLPAKVDATAPQGADTAAPANAQADAGADTAPAPN
ncbi:cytochrome-c peroxidase [uncultured Paracoccus sp.]|uniref:cytochrome-c peroxidase n=1 Tax=uncultured Paracoccus sp. TaxID=189685 RepID=UPI00261BFA99|nr:cytochrome-c peroxidase [uncultured Paracoccus sp.]